MPKMSEQEILAKAVANWIGGFVCESIQDVLVRKYVDFPKNFTQIIEHHLDQHNKRVSMPGYKFITLGPRFTQRAINFRSRKEVGDALILRCKLWIHLCEATGIPFTPSETMKTAINDAIQNNIESAITAINDVI